MRSFVIELRRGRMASHLVKVGGEINKECSRESIEKYIQEKLEEIDPTYEAEIELLRIEKNQVEIWVFISILATCQLIEKMAKQWLTNHVNQESVSIKFLKVKGVSPLTRCMSGD